MYAFNLLCKRIFDPSLCDECLFENCLSLTYNFTDFGHEQIWNYQIIKSNIRFPNKIFNSIYYDTLIMFSIMSVYNSSDDDSLGYLSIFTEYIAHDVFCLSNNISFILRLWSLRLSLNLYRSRDWPHPNY